MLYRGKPSRVTLMAGHYGSGKTTLAVNYALWLRQAGLPTVIADLDIVNPYFRTRDAMDVLNANGIPLIASPFAGSNVDAPAMPPEAYRVVEDKSVYGVIDVGGDDRGALALGRYVPYLLRERDYLFLCVINRYRPLTATADDTLSVMAEIEQACGLRFNGLCNASNLGAETTAETVREGLGYARDVSRQSGVPLVMTCAQAHLAEELTDVPDLFLIRHTTAPLFMNNA